MRAMTPLVVSVLLAVVMLLIIGLRLVLGADDNRPSTPVKIPISRETTYLLEPIGEDGNIDYLQAFRMRLKQGVTPENNAVVPLVRAWGPSVIPEEVDPDEFWLELGIEPLPVEGNYYEAAPLDEFAEWIDSILQADEYSSSTFGWLNLWLHAQSRPWKSEQLPMLAAWLERNDFALDAVVRASRQDKYYFPVVASSKENGVINEYTVTSVANLGMARDAVAALSMRAMQCLGDGLIEDAWSDALAIRRLVRLLPNNMTIVDGLIGSKLHDSSELCEEAILSSRRLTRTLLEDISKHRHQESLLNPTKPFEFGERCLSLWVYSNNVRNGLPPEDIFLNPKWAKGRFEFDWPLLMERTNDMHDHFREIASWPLEERSRALQKMIKKADDTKRRIEALSIEDLTKLSVRERTLLFDADTQSTFPLALKGFFKRCDFDRIQSNLMQVAVSLAEYRLNHGEYPRTVSQLARIWRDPISREAFYYERRDDGYLLYSAGPNGIDNLGSDFQKSIIRGEYVNEIPDDKYQEYDDIVIRMPVPAFELRPATSEK